MEKNRAFQARKIRRNILSNKKKNKHSQPSSIAHGNNIISKTANPNIEVASTFSQFIPHHLVYNTTVKTNSPLYISESSSNNCKDARRRRKEIINTKRLKTYNHGHNITLVTKLSNTCFQPHITSSSSSPCYIYGSSSSFASPFSQFKQQELLYNTTIRTNSTFHIGESSSNNFKDARKRRKEIIHTKRLKTGHHGDNTTRDDTHLNSYDTPKPPAQQSVHLLSYTIKKRRGKYVNVPTIQRLTFNVDNPSQVIQGISDVYIDDGDSIYTCRSCGALMWYYETMRGQAHGKTGSYSLCCQSGKIVLPLSSKSPPALIMNLLSDNHPKSKNFIQNIRRYNNMFAFTSMGGKVDHSVNNGKGPYIYRIRGQNVHRMGGLLPADHDPPKFSQLYIYDTTNEVANRLNSSRSNHNYSSEKDEALDIDLIDKIKQLLDTCNPLVQMFRMARDRFILKPDKCFKLKLINKRNKDGRTYNLPTAPEIAALVPGDIDMAFDKRDIILESHNGQMQRISELHPQYLALQYPLLFVYAQDGYRPDIYHKDESEDSTKKQKRVTMREFFAYMIQERPSFPTLLLRSRKLFQQFVVDGYTMVESERMCYIRNQQGNLRSDSYENICKAVNGRNTESSNLGTKVILPSSFTGGARYMMQNYLDAMALCKTFGYPDLFLTFTCNPKWPEILRFLKDTKLSPEDRGDSVARMFKIKLDRLIKSFKDEQIFGEVKALVYTVEFQKRGLPHAHICVFLAGKDKLPEPTDIDRFITAEIPDESCDPQLYILVRDFMMHGPCGQARLSSPCMVGKKKCSKNFPKKISNHTTVDEDGFPVYRRRENGRTVTKSKIELDNRYVVPYNATLLKRYQAHLNVEWCNQVGSIKYLFKYINKGPDRVTAAICDENTDEIKDYYDCRYVSACEAIWRIYKYDIHHRTPAVERLPFHLHGQQTIVFSEDAYIDYVLDKPSVNTSMFTEWMKCNQLYTTARELTYVEFPSKFVWKPNERRWALRSRPGGSVGRIHHASPTSGELFYLRILLNKVKGPTSYEDIRTVNGITYTTYKETCYALGLLDDDKEYIDCIHEAKASASGPFLRSLFVMLLISNTLTRPEFVWEKTRATLSEDILHIQRNIHRRPGMTLQPEETQNIALEEIEEMLQRQGSTLKDFPGMPYPTSHTFTLGENRLIDDETTTYDISTLRIEHDKLYSSLTDEQKSVYHRVIDVVYTNTGGLFFLYGYGGTGKTFVWKTLSTAIRSKRHIVLNVASSGIAALLLNGGRTAHSRFAIPINVTEDSFCRIRPDSELATLIRQTKLIIWDEAPMVHKHSFEALDRTLKDILRTTNPNCVNQPFGGKVVVFGGDFRQVLPVVPNGSRQDIVNASLKSSYLWNHCQVLKLTRNMRLTVGSSSTNINQTREFADWILKVGDGKVNDPNDGETEIQIPDDLLIKDDGNPLKSLINSVYPDISNNLTSPLFFQDKAILAPTHESVDLINNTVMDLIKGDAKVYLSSDSICQSDLDPDVNKELYTPDFLNNIHASGILKHKLVLKKDVPVMLLRNIDQATGLCNGTRLQIVRLGERIIEAKVISGTNIGSITFIPRMRLSPSDKRIPFKFQRRQFPLAVCFAMTINKSQGQSLANVGLFLNKPVFSHGQLYVALSRVKSRNGLKVLLYDKEGKATNHTTNVVFKEVLQDL